MAQQTATYRKPLPVMEELTKEFYDWCKQGELRFQRCTNCGAWRHIPWPMCRHCHSFEWEWARSSGRGTVYTFTIVYQALHKAFVEDVPFAGVIIELAEGPRIVSWVTDIPPDQLAIGTPVEVWFDDVTPEVALPKFRTARR